VSGEASWVGSPGNFTHAHVESLFSEGHVSSKANLEKAIFALEYVAQLQDAGLDYVFKGGSAVQILLGDRWNRLSVDVDICTDASEEELRETLEVVKHRFGGRGFTYSARRDEILGPVPFFSFRVTTPPITGHGRVILLDAMGLKPRFATMATPIRSFYYDSDATVTTPTVGAMLGDKLTTIGPTTVGRAMRDSRNGLEYAKHFYDISFLSQAEPDPEECIDAYSESVEIQSRIRRRDFTVDECVKDSVFTCQVACLPQTLRADAFDKLGPDLRERARFEYDILRRGLRGFQPFLVRGVSYTWDQLREYASRTALLTMAIGMDLSRGALEGVLGLGPPASREEIRGLWNDIESLRLPEEQFWFIDPGEILNFPAVLRNWHSFYTIMGND
jgi:hypothetical protein